MSDKRDLTTFQNCLLNGGIDQAKGLLACKQAEFNSLIRGRQDDPKY